MDKSLRNIYVKPQFFIDPTLYICAAFKKEFFQRQEYGTRRTSAAGDFSKLNLLLYIFISLNLSGELRFVFSWDSLCPFKGLFLQTLLKILPVCQRGGYRLFLVLSSIVRIPGVVSTLPAFYLRI
jgi:hypothetical protein